jgi:hypothetical protein
MAKKITPRETCMICGDDPCSCETVNRSKRIKEQIEAEQEDSSCDD